MKMTINEWIPVAASAIYLIPCTLMDIRNRRISGKLAGAGCIGALGWMVSQLILQNLTWTDLVVSAIPGIMLLALSVLGSGSIGAGDGITILILGWLLGCRTVVLILLIGLFLAAGWSAVLLVRKKAGRSTRIPLIPFLLTSFCAWEVFYIWKR